MTKRVRSKTIFYLFILAAIYLYPGIGQAGVGPNGCSATSQICSLSSSSNFILKAGNSFSVGNVIFTMQTDGNFVVYRNGAALWASSFQISGDINGFKGPTYALKCNQCYAAFQSDGNFVLYNPSFNGASNHAYWASRTNGLAKATFIFSQANPFIEIRDSANSFLWSSSSNSSNRFVSDLNQNDPMIWLVKSVCVGAANNILSIDPYNGCPAGTSLRKIQVGEALPYFNKDDFNSQWNNFPVRTASGQILVVDARQFGPNFDHQFRSHDQFDIYAVNVNGDGWVSAINTRDGGGYNTTFFGPNCEVGGGWTLFPINGFRSGGMNKLTIAGNYWQQSGGSFPGACSSVAPTDAISQWQYISGKAFGGLNGGPVKSMDTMVTIHGYEPNANFQSGGHIEVFYFTREYGLTRWEVWTPSAQNPVPDTNSCAGIKNPISYQGKSFIVTDCHDNSDVAIASSPYLPVLPVPNMNMLKHANFDNSGGYTPISDPTLGLWHRAGSSPAGNIINWSLLYSTATQDKGYGGVGVKFLETNCGAGSNGLCGFNMSPPVYQEIFEELPISSFVTGQYYSYGISARVNPSSGTNAQGTIMIGIQQLDANNNYLWGDSIVRTIGVDNGSFPSAAESNSVFLASGFYYNRVQMPIRPGAVKVRFFFSPLSPQNFDIVDGWLAPW